MKIEAKLLSHKAAYAVTILDASLGAHSIMVKFISHSDICVRLSVRISVRICDMVSVRIRYDRGENLT